MRADTGAQREPAYAHMTTIAIQCRLLSVATEQTDKPLQAWPGQLGFRNGDDVRVAADSEIWPRFGSVESISPTPPPVARGFPERGQ